jgi:hypothetical protein
MNGNAGALDRPPAPMSSRLVSSRAGHAMPRDGLCSCSSVRWLFVARTAFFSLFSVGLLFCAGCKGEGPEIVRHKPQHIEPPEKDRLLAVLVDEKDKTWSFRLAGPMSVVSAHKPKFDQLVKSIKFGEQPAVKWTVPDGWQEEGGGNEFRFATLKTGPDPKMLEVTVVALPVGGGDLLANVNRWRGQLSLPEAEAEELGDMTKPMEIDGRKGTLVDLVGKFANKPKMPMAKPPAAKPRDVPEPAGKKMTYELPPGWAKAKPKNVMINEQFEAVDGADKVEVTIVVLPEGAGGELANVHRWRDQIKLPRVENAEVLKSLVKLQVKTGPAAFVDLDNPKAPGDNRILGVIVPAPGATYFLKMMGPSDILGRQKARFEAFAKSFNVE